MRKLQRVELMLLAAVGLVLFALSWLLYWSHYLLARPLAQAEAVVGRRTLQLRRELYPCDK